MSTATTVETDTSVYLSLREAEALGFGSPHTLRRRIRDGKLVAVKIGGRLKVRRRDLEQTAITVDVDPIDAAIDEIVVKAPALSDDQIDRLIGLLGGLSKRSVERFVVGGESK